MRLDDMKPIVTTYEAVHGDHVYRAIVGADDVMIKRTRNEERPIWHHGILTEAYDRDAQAFVPMVNLNSPKLSHEAADAVLQGLSDPAPGITR